METRIEYIGLVDKNGVPHGVELRDGLNIITGRSSTGKSALIEIFDYCMGASTSTIPKGKITDNAAVYVLVIKIDKVQWVLGHDASSKSTFYMIKDVELNSGKNLTLEYFNAGCSLNLDNYRRKLGRLFGLTITDTTEDDNPDVTKAKGRPSIRNMMSYILQHQNLIANKLALFYRFDEKEKKDDVIEQFKIFAGFVDAKYYDLIFQIKTLKAKLRNLTSEVEVEKIRKESLAKNIDDVLLQYKEITNNDLFDIQSATYVIEQAKLVREKIKETTLQDVIVTQKKEDAEHVKAYDNLLRDRNELHAQIRLKQLKLQDYEETIAYVEEYNRELKNVDPLKKVTIDYSVCPFCKQHTNIIEDEVMGLVDSINRLNKNLREVPMLNDEVYTKRTETKNELDCLYQKLDKVEEQIKKIQVVIKELRKNRSLMEQGYKKMLDLEAYIDVVIEINESNLENTFEKESARLAELELTLKNTYGIKNKMTQARTTIENYMEEYRKCLPFEESLDEYKMCFDLDTFELYFEKGRDKTRLRSIGSGKNWLNAHLCLFLALSRYFYTNKKSKLPTLLFIDQPSQVYFPTNDREEVFDAVQMVESREGEKNSGKDKEPSQYIKDIVDQDMEEVTNIFNTLYKFTTDVNKGVQVVVTEHADNLKLHDVDFNELVRARWRKADEGLIMSREQEEKKDDSNVQVGDD